MNTPTFRKRWFFRTLASVLIVFLIEGDAVRCYRPSETLQRAPSAYQLAAASFADKLSRAAATNNEEVWIQAVRVAALDFAETCETAGMQGKEIQHHVAKFLKSIETQHRRPIPVQIATQAAHFVLYDEMEAFLRREIEFSAAKGEKEKEDLYRQALYELFLARFYSPFYLGENSYSVEDDKGLKVFFEYIVVSEVSKELIRKIKLEDLFSSWKIAYENFLKSQNQPNQESCLRNFESLIKNNSLHFSSWPRRYPYSMREEAQIVQVGLRYVINRIDRGRLEGVSVDPAFLDRCIDEYVFNYKSDLISQLKTSEISEDEFKESLSFLKKVFKVNIGRFRFDTSPKENSEGVLFYEVTDAESGRVYKITPAPEGNTLAETILHVSLDSEIVPEKDLSITSRGVLTRDGKIKINPRLHDNTLDLLSTWAHELFHLKWIYTLKSRPLFVADWTNRIVRQREIWEKIEKAYLQIYGQDPAAREEWFRSSTQRKVNEILALAFGCFILEDGADRKLSPGYQDEFQMLWTRFGLSAEMKLTQRMADELGRFQPILDLLEAHREVKSVFFAEILAEPLSDIKKMDASFTEADIAMPCDRAVQPSRVRLPSLDPLFDLIKRANPRLIISERNSTGMMTLLMQASSDTSLLDKLLELGIENIPRRVELALALTETAKRLGLLQAPDAQFRMVRAVLNLLSEPESSLKKLKASKPPNLLELFDRLPFEQAV